MDFHHILKAFVPDNTTARLKLLRWSSGTLDSGHFLVDMRTIWVPSGAEERSYYDRLFQLADVSNTGKLAGQGAVLFLARSGLAFPILKQVRITGLACVAIPDSEQRSERVR